MKNKLFLRFLALLLVMPLGILPGMAETVTYTVASTASVNKTGTAPGGSSATFKNTYTNTKEQMTSGNSQTLTLKGFTGCTISNITLSMKSNTSKGAGKLSYSTDGGTTYTYLVGSSSAGVNFNDNAWNGSYSSTYGNISKDVTILVGTSDLVIKIEATTNSLFCQSYALTYVSANADPCTVSFNVGAGNCSTTALTETSAGAGVTLPTADISINGWEFAGWAAASCSETTTAPTLFEAGSTYKPSENCTLYAVYKQEGGLSAEESKLQTLEYDSWTYSGTTTDKSSFRLFADGAYVESAAFNLATLSKVIVYGGTFGGASYNGISIKDEDGNVWQTGTVSGSSQTGTNTFTGGNSLTGTKKLRVYSTSGDGNTGVRISKVEIYGYAPGYTYNSNPTPQATVNVTGVSLNKTSLTLTVGGSETLTATVTPDNATNKNVTWSSSAPGVATVSDGVVTAVSAGSATITVTTEDGEFTATCAVTVNPVTYSVTYNANGGSGTMTDSNAYTSGATVTTLDNSFTKTGYSFAGWNTAADGSGTAYEAGDNFSITANTTLYAQWVATVTFDAGTGTCSSASLTETSMGAGVTLPTANPVNGWTFLGWATESVTVTNAKPTYYESGNIYNPVNGNVTLYAVYKRGEGEGSTFKLSLVVDDVTHYVGGMADTKKYMNDVTDEAYAVELGIEESSGKNYLYYMNDETKTYIYISGDNTSLSFATSLTSSVKNWTITESDGKYEFKTTATGTRNLAYNKTSPRFAAYTGSDSYPYQFTKTAMAEVYYNTNPSATEDIPVESVTIDASATMTAGEIVKLTPTITPDNVTDAVITWKSSDSSVATVDNEGNVTAVAKGTCNITVTVRTLGVSRSATCAVTVNPVYYTLTYHANGGVGSMTDDDSPYEANSLVYIKDNEFTRDGYIFAGWDSERDGTGEESYPERGSFRITGNITLYAQWTVKGENSTIFHEGFGYNNDSARNWSDSYKEQSGVSTVYSGATYTITNAKQSKYTVGSTNSGLAQSSSSSDAIFLVGPLNLSAYADGTDVTLSYKWKAASVNGTYSTNVYYATSKDGEFTEIPNTAVGATSFVDVSVAVPAEALTSTTYIKVVFNTSNTQAVIDEFDISGKQSKADPHLAFDLPVYYIAEDGIEDMPQPESMGGATLTAVTFSTTDADIAEEYEGSLMGYADGNVTITATLPESDSYLGGTAQLMVYVLPSELTPEIELNDMRTFSCAHPLDFTSATGVKAYVAKSVGTDYVIVEEYTGGYVPANTGLLLIGAGGDVNIPTSTEVRSVEIDNLLRPALKGVNIPASDDGFTRYVFGKKSGETDKKFHRLTADMASQGDFAYLEIPVEEGAGAAAVASRRVVFNGTTGAENVVVDAEDGEMYNVWGQRVDESYRGIVIIKGKKILKKD